MSDPGVRFDRILAEPGVRMRVNELGRVERYRDRRQEHLVSVIMPTWNRAFVLERAVDSVLAQSYRNLELILVDDGSTDGTEGRIAHRAAADPRLRYVRRRHHGVSATRNAGLARARGSIIAYLDTDNAWTEHYLLLMVHALDEADGHECVYCAARVIDRIGGRESILFRPYDRRRLLERNFVDLNTFVHRSELVSRWGGFDERIEGVEDWELILRYTQERPPLVLDCALVEYHRDPTYDHLTLRADLVDNCRRVREIHGSGDEVRLPPPG